MSNTKKKEMEYHHIEVKIQTEVTPPYFTGSMIRGALGHALKKITCINPSYVCDGCFGASSCLYYDFYEKQNTQHKYRLDVVLSSHSFDFGFYLFGDACKSLPYVLSALEMAVTQNGLGKNRTTYKNIEINVNSLTIYENGEFMTSINIDTEKIEIESYTPNVKIKFLTPLRIKKANALEYKDIKIENILRSIHQRKKQIFENVLEHSLDYTPNYTTTVKALEYKPLYRRSDRQVKVIVMDGVIGEMAVIGIDKRSYELLKIAEFIAVGKQTVFGLGKISIEEVT